MNGDSTWFIVACVLVGAMGVIGLGILFTRAENIERPNLVGLCTVATSLIAVGVLVLAGRHGLNVSLAVSLAAVVISVLGFVLGRVWDVALGPRLRVHHDNATLDADLAD